MKKIPTIFKRDPVERRYVLDEVNPSCQWVLDGEGVATRKYNGTCVARLEDIGWVARREVKLGKTIPPGFVEQDMDKVTGKRFGYEPIQQSPFYKFWKEAIENEEDFEYVLPLGTYELCGPKIQGNNEDLQRHMLLSHEHADHVGPLELTYEGLREAMIGLREFGYEGIVSHHPDGRMAKLKTRDFRLPPLD